MGAGESSDSLGVFCGNVTAGTLVANPYATSLVRFMVIQCPRQILPLQFKLARFEIDDLASASISRTIINYYSLLVDFSYSY